MILFTNKYYTQSFIYTIADATEEKKKKNTHLTRHKKPLFTTKDTTPPYLPSKPRKGW